MIWRCSCHYLSHLPSVISLSLVPLTYSVNMTVRRPKWQLLVSSCLGLCLDIFVYSSHKPVLYFVCMDVRSVRWASRGLFNHLNIDISIMLIMGNRLFIATINNTASYQVLSRGIAIWRAHPLGPSESHATSNAYTVSICWWMWHNLVWDKW